VYAHLVSLSNLNRLVDKLANSKRAQAASAVSLDEPGKPV
jgi:hypothetical protein